MSLGHVLVHRDVAAALGTADMAGDPCMVLENFDSPIGQTDIDPTTDQPVRQLLEEPEQPADAPYWQIPPAIEEIERHAPAPLPGAPFEYAEWKTARVHPDYHVEVDKTFYSRIQRSTISTAPSILPLSRGLRLRVGKIVVS
jgi:hypothetical protein